MNWINIKDKTPDTDTYLVLSNINWYHGGCYEANSDGTTISVTLSDIQKINDPSDPYTLAWSYLPKDTDCVSEKLPDATGHYLVLHDDIPQKWCVAYFNGADWNTHNVKKWFSLPEIPEKYIRKNIKFQKTYLPANIYLQNVAWADYCESLKRTKQAKH